jgi:CRISPR-associated protein Cas2
MVRLTSPFEPPVNVAPAQTPTPDWWLEAFALRPSPSEAAGHRCGEHQMLTLVAYDISDPKRLHNVARLCEDYGLRVQYSVFECRLEADRFDKFWIELQSLLDTKEDRIIAYKICTRCARDVRVAGTQVLNEKVVAYLC